MKFSAIVRRIIESATRAKGVIEIIFKSGIGGDLLPQAQELVEDLFELAALLQPSFGNQLPGLLTNSAVGLFQKSCHLRQRSLLPLELNRQ